MKLIEATEEPKLFAPWFRDRETWAPWFAFLCAVFGEEMTDEQALIFKACTKRTILPTAPSEEAWLVCGRRAGKSFILALIAVYLACFRNYEEHLAPGERATVLVIATDRRQARVILRYVRAMLTRIPLLSGKVLRDTSEAFDLKNNVSIEVGTASYRSTRGYTYCAVLCDELSFWQTDDAAEPDYAILDALRPGMSTIPGAMLLCASSPYARRGALWDAYKEFFGKDGTPLVWQAPTRTMNPTVPQAVIDRAMARDPISAAAEYGAQFRTDVEGYVSREAVQAVTTDGKLERAPIRGVSYTAFVDPSGGSVDAMTMAIAHVERGVAVLDVVRERKPPFSPDDVVEEFAKTLRAYGVFKVRGDRYGAEWTREAFRRHGVVYEPSDFTRSELYRELLPKINSGEVELLDLPILTAQLVNLERRTSRGGRETIDHAPGGHDDVANSVAGVLVSATATVFEAPSAVVGFYRRA